MSEVQIGKLIDDHYRTRERRLTAEKAIEELKKIEAELAEMIMNALDDAGLSKATGGLATAAVVEGLVASVEDWDEFYKYIQRNKAYHLLERRVANDAYREELDNRKGINLPGVVPFIRRKISLTKVG
jgi:hypothetical protein